MAWVLPPLDEWVSPRDLAWWIGLVVAGFARGADLLSTWIATPRLQLEGNPLARRLGWKGGVILILLVVPVVACWPMLAVSLATTSSLVAARNLQQAWLMRTMGEERYRLWFTGRVLEASQPLVVGCHMGEAALTGTIGLVLMWLGPVHLISFGVGLGIAAYGFSVALFTGMSLWRFR